MTTTTDVRSHGARGDGVAVETAAIQAAIDACHASGGGEILVPAGTYVVGTIRLRSRVTLTLAPGSTLRATRDPAAYAEDVAGLEYAEDILRRGMFSPFCLLYAEGEERVTIRGSGTIDGDWSPPGDERKQRPMLIRVVGCAEVTLAGLTLTRPPSFTCYFEHSTNIRVRDVTIRSRTTPNGDGLDFNGCEDVSISGCNLDCGDDAISLKPLRRGRPSRRFVVSDCVISSAWAAVRLGPESFGGMQDIVVRSSIFHDCRDGLKVQNCEGAVMEDLVFSDLLMRRVNRPLFFTLNRFPFARDCDPQTLVCGKLRRIRCSGIHATSRRPASDSLFEMACNAFVGLPGACIEDVTLRDVRLTMPGGGTDEDARRLGVGELDDARELWPEAKHFGGPLPCSSLYLRHVRGFRLDDIRFTVEEQDRRPPIAGEDCRDLGFRGLTAWPPPQDARLWRLADSSEVVAQA